MNLITTTFSKCIFTLSFLLLCVTVFAQTPEGINYQAVIRKTDGSLVANTTIAIRIQLKQNSATGTVVYSERQSVITSQYGLVNFVIGQGTVLSGTFSTINWSTGNYWVSLGVDFANGTNYLDYGSQRLMSAPYALYAKTAGVQLNQWRYGATAPAAALGNIGDFYLNTATGDVHYKSAASTWTLTGNIKGPQGNAGATGPQGPAGSNGANSSTGVTAFRDLSSAISTWTLKADAPVGTATPGGTEATANTTDAGVIIVTSTGNPNIIRVPIGLTNFPVNHNVTVMQGGNGQVQILPVDGSGVNIRSANDMTYLRTKYSAATLVKKSNTEWVMFGDLTNVVV